MPRRQGGRVWVSEHASQRWAARGGRGELRAWDAHRAITAALRSGARYRHDVIIAPFDAGRAIVASPMPEGGWVVVTVLVLPSWGRRSA
ncbi:MAG: hypothetical protein K6T92_02675 [Candidatus Rokubacteria bacterium]|nr:hypothetical protein [Candidatus Rokubacteria bacterium]